jgi:hypothetical protein
MQRSLADGSRQFGGRKNPTSHSEVAGAGFSVAYAAGRPCSTGFVVISHRGGSARVLCVDGGMVRWARTDRCGGFIGGQRGGGKWHDARRHYFAVGRRARDQALHPVEEDEGTSAALNVVVMLPCWSHVSLHTRRALPTLPIRSPNHGVGTGDGRFIRPLGSSMVWGVPLQGDFRTESPKVVWEASSNSGGNALVIQNGRIETKRFRCLGQKIIKLDLVCVAIEWCMWLLQSTSEGICVFFGRSAFANSNAD